MSTPWSPSSWQEHGARQQPEWPDSAEVDGVLKAIGDLPPLVFAGEARRLTADLAEVELMWGCMDESRISIAAALHAALACPATRYLDLDGSLDLGRDVVEGGFVLESGIMRVTGEPGLGIRLCE